LQADPPGKSALQELKKSFLNKEDIRGIVELDAESYKAET
jgi:hypothetical protein